MPFLSAWTDRSLGTRLARKLGPQPMSAM
jgi:hypothetical protein